VNRNTPPHDAAAAHCTIAYRVTEKALNGIQKVTATLLRHHTVNRSRSDLEKKACQYGVNITV